MTPRNPPPTGTGSEALGSHRPQSQRVALPQLTSAEDPSQADRSGGWVHSHETTSTVDGPGFRYTVWLAGCHLRCQYCHNPDTWALQAGNRRTSKQVIDDARRFATFLRSTKGGFTVSGGEPLVQKSFAIELIRHAKQDLKLHTALDTNGYLGDQLLDDELSEIDLVILDLKAYDTAHHRRVTGFGNEKILSFARRLARLGRPAWVRYVLVPGLTDIPEEVEAIGRFVGHMSNVERLEVLPFHQLGRAKWMQLGQRYALADTPPASREQAADAVAQFHAAGCGVAC
ncbi:pyruvate formate-lyase-activating protein [Mucisphaera sp.]|uniref:pyruvate formate-lyase-activating protein n=1 Tax=Mucisphaera sp. TaxID=2913024 RepID=UPI003D121C23